MRPVYEMVAFATVASDLGVQAALTVAQVYPPDKVAHIQELSMKYNELKKNRKDWEPRRRRSEAAKRHQCGDVRFSMEAGSLIRKRRLGSGFPKANKMLGLMILADTMVGLKAVQSVQILLNMGSRPRGTPWAGSPP